jgi:hypothetical protein
MATHSPDGAEQAAALRAELAGLRARLARAERALGARRAARRRRRWLAGLLAILVAVPPLGLLAAHPFKDLRPGSPHNGDIDLIYSAGITQGCAADRFCPTDAVTNEQLATLLARTAGLGRHKPVVHANTAVNATSAANADNATRLGGKSAADFVLATGETWVSYSFLNAVPITIFEPPAITYGLGPVAVVEKPGISTDFIVLLPLDLPTLLFGTGWAMRAVEVCYKVDSDAYITSTEVAQGLLGEDRTIVSSATDRRSTVPDCFTLTPATPVRLTAPPYLELVLYSDDADERIHLYSAQVLLTPLD